MFKTNPITRMDFPDPDVIRVDDVYYMISTTMHFFPGGVILKSYDLIHWEIASYMFNELENIPAERLEGESTNYSRGMWAASLRYHNGIFYVVFISNSAKCTFVFTATDPEGIWEKHELPVFCHDASLLFDDDGRVFLFYGNRAINVVELTPDALEIKSGGIHKTVIVDGNDVVLGYEGTHAYKINGKYYLFFIHWPSIGNKRRTQACFVCDSVDGDYVGKDVLDDDMGFHNMGVAQGGIVDTPAGKWFSIMFRDNGAVGRIPVLCPVHWEDDFPVFGNHGRIPDKIDVSSSRPYYRYEPLYTSDDFVYVPDANGQIELKKQWQWNHVPDNSLWRIIPGGGLAIKTGKICTNLVHANNILTQRTCYPSCSAVVDVDAFNLKNGDIAGICALQGCYGFIGITKEMGNYYLVVITRENEDMKPGNGNDFLPGTLMEKVKIPDSSARLCLSCNFDDLSDYCEFFYQKNKRWTKIGPRHKLYFRLDHFVGCRFGLFAFSTEMSGGEAVFRNFKYDAEND